MSTVNCSQCGHEMSFETVAEAMDESRMSFTVTPQPGNLISASTIGGTVTQMDKMLRTITRDLGAKTVTLVERVVTEDDGTIRFDLLIARAEGKPAKRRKKAVQP